MPLKRYPVHKTKYILWLFLQHFVYLYLAYLARGRTDATSEFWEVVGEEQSIQSLFPFILGKNC